MMRSHALRFGLALGVLALLVLPMASAAMLQCSQCNCNSGCYQKCFNGTSGPSQCMFYICQDYCFAGTGQTRAEGDSLETFLTGLEEQSVGLEEVEEEAVPTR